MRRVCLVCGNEFNTAPNRLKSGRGKYCSRECGYQARRMTKNQPCKTCGEEFRPTPQAVRLGYGKYCSIGCRAKGMSGENHPMWKGGLAKCKCEICGKEFDVPQNRFKTGPVRYCSTQCMGKGQIKSVQRFCGVCGKELSIWPSEIASGRGQYCSLECKGVASRGENSPHWKGGAESERDTWEYKEWRKAVYARDNWTCQDCGDKSSGKFHAHHIFRFADFPEHRLELWNGITLCEKCHAKCHPELTMICASVL